MKWLEIWAMLKVIGILCSAFIGLVYIGFIIWLIIDSRK